MDHFLLFIAKVFSCFDSTTLWKTLRPPKSHTATRASVLGPPQATGIVKGHGNLSSNDSDSRERNMVDKKV